MRTGAYRPGLGASWGREIAKSDRPRSGWVATPGGIQPSDRRHMRSEALCELPVVMAGGSCVQAEFEYRVFGIGHAGAATQVAALVWMVPVHDGLDLQR